MTTKWPSWLARDCLMGQRKRGGVLEPLFWVPAPKWYIFCPLFGICPFSSMCFSASFPTDPLMAVPFLTVLLSEIPKPKLLFLLTENRVCWRERDWENVQAEGFILWNCTSGFLLWNSNMMSFLFLSLKRTDSCLGDFAFTFSSP